MTKSKTIVFLASELANLSASLATLNKYSDKLENELHAAQVTRDALNVENGTLANENVKLHEDLRNAEKGIIRSQGMTDDQYRDHARALLLVECLKNPDGFAKSIAFLRDVYTHRPTEFGNKIALIKRVHELSGWGLREAKDLVVTFGYYPSYSTQDPSVSQATSHASTGGVCTEG